MQTTREVARELGVTPGALRQHIAAGNIDQPKRRAGMMFLWTPAEIKAARLDLSAPGRRRPRYVAESLGKGVSGE